MTLVRAAFVLLAVTGGAGLVMYAAFWALVPQRQTGAPARRADRSQLLGFLLLGIGGALAGWPPRTRAGSGNVLAGLRRCRRWGAHLATGRCVAAGTLAVLGSDQLEAGRGQLDR